MTVGALEIGDVCFPQNNNNKKGNGCKQVYRWLWSKHVSALLPMLLCKPIQSLQSLSLCGLSEHHQRVSKATGMEKMVSAMHKKCLSHLHGQIQYF